MKILVLSQYYYPEKFLINDIIVELLKVHELIVLTGKPNYPFGVIYDGFNNISTQITESSGLKVIRVPIIPRKKNLFFLLLNYLSFIFSTLFIIPFKVKKNDFDIILSYGLSPSFQSLGLILLNFYYRKPFVTWIQDLWPNSFIQSTGINNFFINTVINTLNKFIYSRNNLLLLQSSQFSDFVAKLSPNTPQYYLPNPAPNELTKMFFQKIFNEKKVKKFQVLFAGNLGKVQGLNILLDAAYLLKKTHSNIEFHIYGNGSYENQIKFKITELNLTNVLVFNQVSLKEIGAKLLHADALLLSLIDDPVLNLTIPTKMQAYMSMGKPIIGVVNGEARKIILEAKCGVLVDPGDLVGLYSALIEISNMSKNQLDCMGKSGLSFYSENFSMQKIVSQLESCLNSCLNNFKVCK